MASEEAQDQLMEAVLGEHDDATAIAGIDAALAAGADFTSHGVEPLHFAAIGRKPGTKLGVIRHLFARGATLAGELVNNGLHEDPPGTFSVSGTALHWACDEDDLEMVQVLFEGDASAVLETFEATECTPLITASREGHLRIVEFLIQRGANVNAVQEGRAGDCALAMAIEKGHTKVVELLLRHGANPHIRGFMWITPLHRAEDYAARSPEIAAMVRAAAANTVPSPQPPSQNPDA